MTRAVFLGTPGSAVPTLRALDDVADVALVVTQPDRPRGRSRRPHPPEVKTAAHSLGLPVAQPETAGDLLETLSSVAPIELGVVVAYGRILRPEVLRIPRHGLLNLHFSLLPRWRGAAPVARAIEAGDEMTGVTIIHIDEGLDTGPVLTAQAMSIDPGENAGSLTDRLAVTGARLMKQVIPGYLDGTITPVPQSDDGVTYAAKIEPSDRPIDLTRSAVEIINKVRSLAPDPGATLMLDGAPHKILEARAATRRPEPGIWDLDSEGFPTVAALDGGVTLTSLQPPSRKPMDGASWARGRRVSTGLLG